LTQLYQQKIGFITGKPLPRYGESKINSSQFGQKIFIPINWSFHEESEGIFDFANSKPETDLAKLANTIEKVGKEPVFFIPLTPQPFLVNGGIPSYLSRTLNQSPLSMGVATVDNMGNMNKHYSFFYPKVFQSFSLFAEALNRYFTQSGIKAPVYGLNSGYVEKTSFKSYFYDSSVAFENGFSRYIKQRFNDLSDEERIIEDFKDPKLRQDYSELIWNLYLEALKENIPGNYSGVLKVAFVGGAPSDIFMRSFDRLESPKNYFTDIFYAICNDVFPSLTLIKSPVKRGVLEKMIKDLMNHDYIDQNLDPTQFIDETLLSYLPYRVFQIYKGADIKTVLNNLSQSGFLQILNSKYQWMYEYYSELNFEEDTDYTTKVYVISEDISSGEINKLLKAFMSGAKIIWDIQKLSREHLTKVESFIYENSLETESINYLSTVRYVKLGEGKMIMFNGTDFHKHSPSKKEAFWSELFKFLNLKQLEITSDPDVQYYWRSRETNSYELNYSQIRRVSFYNPTSYKKKVKIYSEKNFAYLKSMDELNTEVKSTPVGVELTLKPNGSISLDYGYYE
jgi:hypothetical protein